ncbi:hypothetical protein Tsubulata_038170 [Turnera subulata]|uniref:Delta(3)-Delta(2)-enoyl-CoA isomerase n=1 Tax=Turnera subulata TaxID=218843 RepID=A0A9Q0GE95_9ROSI|nr:hypothetical protein Tsubulata_038170 [Turnera subulata]
MCTLEQRGSIFILTLTGADQHRFNPTLIASFLSALQQAKSQATPGSVLITTSQGNCFSSGIDLAWARGEGKRPTPERLLHLLRLLKPVAAELISLPMPTIAAVQGHSIGAGMLVALSHDYVLVMSDSGVMYMSELDLGFPMPEYFSVLFRAKLGSVAARREMLLRGTKLKGEEAVRMGIVDSAHGSEGELREAAMRLGEELAKRKWEGEAYREIRKSLYPELCEELGLDLVKVVPKL